MGMNMIVYQIVNEFKRLDEVIAITLAGSCASGRKDSYSDIDINIITNEEILIEKRESIAKKFSDIIEINNTSYRKSDEFILRNSSTQIDISYFNFKLIRDKLSNILDEYNAKLGYTTCLWNNVINSIIVYDKFNNFKDLKEKYNIEYPIELKKNIISKNYPMLKKKFSSYYNQIEKAINRRDLLNITNRVSAFLDSYFDIIFAINDISHPGENRLLNIAKVTCNKLPEKFIENVELLIESIDKCDTTILTNIDNILEQLDIILKNEDLIDLSNNGYIYI